MRVILLVLILVMAPTAGLLPVGVGGQDQAGAQARRHPAGLAGHADHLARHRRPACTIAGFLVMFFTQNQGYGGLFAP